MEQNTTRKTLSEKLQEAEVQYDISRMSIERDYHISQGYIFDQAIKEKKEELKKIHQPENNSKKFINQKIFLMRRCTNELLYH